MYLILQQENPDDYIIATGKTISLKDFIKITFDYFGLKYVIMTKWDYIATKYVSDIHYLQWSD